ncbi:right-handed parallel beta-helix repeat-containing protein [Patescibacteria group bacterium]
MKKLFTLSFFLLLTVNICWANFGLRLKTDNLREELEILQNLPRANIVPAPKPKDGDRSVSLLSHLNYTPSKYATGQCFSAAPIFSLNTALSIAMDRQLGTYDLISTQYVNACADRISPETLACCIDVVHYGQYAYLLEFLRDAKSIILTSNDDAEWQDDDGDCNYSCLSLSTDPLYTIDLPDEPLSVIPTEENAIANIESVLDQSRAIPITISLPNSSATETFVSAYMEENESTIFDLSYLYDEPFDSLYFLFLCIVGYGQDYWECLASFGPTANRPNCIMRISKDFDYQFTFPVDPENDLPVLTLYDLVNPHFELYEPAHITGSPIYTIQNAINNAPYFGGKAIVDDGEYSMNGYHNLDFLGKDFTLISENGPENCILNGNDEHRLFIFDSDETRKAIVSGITISGGFDPIQGGGILIDAANPTIENCIFQLCITGDDAGNGFGAGIACLNDSKARIIDSEIKYNQAATAGGGIYVNASSPFIINTTLDNNSSGTGGGICIVNSDNVMINRCFLRHNASFGGSGIFAINSNFRLSYSTIDDNIIWLENMIENRGSGIHLNNSNPDIKCNFIMRNRGGSGIYCTDSSPLISFGNYIALNKNNLLTGNGGGITCYGGAPRIYDNLIWRNEGHKGAGIYCQDSAAIINDNIISENTATTSTSVPPTSEDFNGGGIYITNSSFSDESISLSNNLILDNEAEKGGGIYTYNDNSIFWNCTISDNISTESTGMEIETHESNSTINYTILQPGTSILEGANLQSCNLNAMIVPAGNINQDPVFTSVPWVGSHFLAQQPEGIINPSINFGDTFAANICFETTRNENMCMSVMTTKTTRGGDVGKLDIGYHYRGWSSQSPPADKISEFNPYIKRPITQRSSAQKLYSQLLLQQSSPRAMLISAPWIWDTTTEHGVLNLHSENSW